MNTLANYIFLNQASNRFGAVTSGVATVDYYWFLHMYKNNPSINVHEWLHNTTGCEYLKLVYDNDGSSIMVKWTDKARYQEISGNIKAYGFE